jgi:hypothetical protein
MRIFFALIFSFPLIALAHQQSSTMQPEIDECSAQLSFRLKNHITFNGLQLNGLDPALAGSLETKLRSITYLDSSVALFKMIDQNLVLVRAINDADLLRMVQFYLKKDMQILNRQLPDGNAPLIPTEREYASELLQRAWENENRLHEFLKMNFEAIDADVAGEVFASVALAQAASYPTLFPTDRAGEDFKIESIIDWVKTSDPLLRNQFSNILQMFFYKMQHEPPRPSSYFSYIDSMFKIIFLWERIYNLREMYEPLVASAVDRPASLDLLEKLSDLVGTRDATRMLIDRRLDQFLNEVGPELMHADAMFYHLEPTDPKLLKHVVDRFEEFARNFVLADQ